MGRGRLARKYLVVLVTLVTGALVTSGAVELRSSYLENQAALVALHREQARGAAFAIESFVREIERQLAWTAQPQFGAPAAALEQRRLDAVRLQKQVPAVTELSHLDARGREILRVSRLAPDVVGGGADFSRDPMFLVPKSGRSWFGPVTFRKESEPYMTIAIPQIGGGVTVAEVNLKFIEKVVSEIKVGRAGLAYAVDGTGTLIAHREMSLVLQKTSLAGLAQVKDALAPAAGGDGAPIARDLKGNAVLTAHAPIALLGWVVFVEQPLEEAFVPVRAAAYRVVLLVAFGIAFAAVASVVLARRLARPIQALQASAARIGAGELDHRIDVRSGDELEALADEFNRMTARLRESYATLEQKVEDRTRELTEALEQQTATAEILRVISGSPTDVQPVFEAVLASAVRLCGARFGGVFRFDGELVHFVTAHEWPAEHLEVVRRHFPMPPGEESLVARSIRDRRIVQVPDYAADPALPRWAVENEQRLGARSTIALPLLREGSPVGGIVLARAEAGLFSEKHIALLQIFADQAVIAIENVRLFKELEEKNRVVSEALEQQTGTAEILRVISGSPTDVQPVFDAISRSAARLCEAQRASVILLKDGVLHRVAGHFSAEALGGPDWYPRPLGTDTLVGRSILNRSVVHAPDVLQESGLAARAAGRRLLRAQLTVPMLREGEPIGAIAATRETPGPFSERHIALLQTFADQAVIAIENVRLFKELEARNADLTETLAQQTSTSEILRAISASPTDVQPVFDAIAQSAVRLCDGLLGALFRFDGELMHVGALYGYSDAGLEATRRAFPTRPDRGTLAARALLDRKVVHVPDVASDPEFGHTDLARTAGWRSLLVVPMFRGGDVIGTVGVARAETGPFTERQIELLKTFADQAVIAIENVRLFQELQARTADLTRSVGELEALGEVGRAISSTLDLETVLATIVSRANELAETDGGAIYEFDGATRAFRLRATDRFPAEFVAALRATPLVYGEGAVGRAAATRMPVQVPDVTDTDAYVSRVRDVLVRSGYRSLLAVPLVSEDEVVGALVVNRRTAGEFPARTVELLRTFATQSALALQNARLFQEIEDKGRELEIANQHKSEFLASVSHELRTPLNAIIGFSEVMLERMFGEVNAKQDEYLHDILDSGRHLLSLINDILDLAKIEAGRMELEPGDFHLPQAIDNALILVRERAVRRGLTLDRWIDPQLGEIKGDERKIKQVLVNLLSNAVKFTPEGGRVDVRAVLTDGLAEISVADTGVGIAPEDQEAVFEEFRQVGTDYARKHEGTGLGLTLARKFVELHGGRIWVKSQVGQGSTFTFTIPVRPWQAS